MAETHLIRHPLGGEAAIAGAMPVRSRTGGSIVRHDCQKGRSQCCGPFRITKV